MSVKLNVLNLDSACISCIKSYKTKHRLSPGEPFEIGCSGIPKEYVSEDVKKIITDEAYQSMVSIVDPVKWAEEMLDWHCIDPYGEVWKRKTRQGTLGPATPYRPEYDELIAQGKSAFNRPQQATMLRCSAKYKVFRIGRQFGKCLVSGTSVQLADGRHKNIEDLQDGELIISLDEKSNSFVVNPAYKLENNIKPVYKISLADGREIEATENHKFLSRKRSSVKRSINPTRSIFTDTWKEVKNLNTLDYLAVPINTSAFGKNNIPKHLMTILGCMIADGNMTGNNLRFTNENPTIVKHFAESIQEFGAHLKSYPSDTNDITYHLMGSGGGKKSLIRDWFKDIELFGLNSYEKHIPDYFMTGNKESTKELLRALFGCDGWASVDKNNGAQIGYATCSERLAFQVISLLARFGIYADIRKKITKLNGQKFVSRQIFISRKKSIEIFRNEIGILGKKDAVEFVYKVAQAKQGSRKTEAYEANNHYFIKIKSIEFAGNKMTWDITVPGTNTFIANNIVSHNSEILTIAALHALYTHNNFNILIVAPYQAQVHLLFDRIDKLINSSPILLNSRKRYVKAPNYTMELFNGSKVIGFTAGTKSAGNADSVRGQKANMLIFDEADYLSSADVASALAVTTNYPEATVWMSSTPTGKRERFFETCHSKAWKEYHFSSLQNPLYNTETEKFYRSQYTEIQYQHEVLAEFGEQEQGVYQNKYIEESLADYKYEDMKPEKDWLYIVGVDWNDVRAGTTIAVTGYHLKEHRFKLFNREIISRENWTQIAACERIVQINRYWNPKWIYIDKGYGHMQHEILKKYGHDSRIKLFKVKNDEATTKEELAQLMSDAKLQDIVKQYDFGSKITVKDPATKTDVEKPAKPYLVENSVRRFEQRNIEISKYDMQLQAELRGYVIDHLSISGTPVYAQGDQSVGDHNLDAFNLSLVGFALEESEFGRVIHDNHVSMSSTFGNIVKAQTEFNFLPTSPGKDSRRNTEDNGVTSRVDQIITPAGKTPGITDKGNNVKLWAWPGWESDAPRPNVNKNRISILSNNRRSGPPSRKKI